MTTMTREATAVVPTVHDEPETQLRNPVDEWGYQSFPASDPPQNW